MKPRQQRGDMPEGRHGHSAVMYGRDMWVYGGTSGLTPKADLWYFNFRKYALLLILLFWRGGLGGGGDAGGRVVAIIVNISDLFLEC